MHNFAECHIFGNFTSGNIAEFCKASHFWKSHFFCPVTSQAPSRTEVQLNISLTIHIDSQDVISLVESRRSAWMVVMSFSCWMYFVLIACAHGHFREETTLPTYTSRNLHGGVSASVTAAGQVEIGGTDRTEEPSGFIDKTLIRRQIETRPFQANRTGSGQTKTDSEINYDLVSRTAEYYLKFDDVKLVEERRFCEGDRKFFLESFERFEAKYSQMRGCVVMTYGKRFLDYALGHPCRTGNVSEASVAIIPPYLGLDCAWPVYKHGCSAPENYFRRGAACFKQTL